MKFDVPVIILVALSLGAFALVGYYLALKLQPSRDEKKQYSRQQVLFVGVVLLLLAFNVYQAWQIRGLESDSGIVDAFSKLWYYPKKYPTWNGGMRWLGVETEQFPMDVWVHQEIISEVKPDFIIEAGTYLGGSALIWAMVLEQVNPEGRVITIDNKDHQPEAAAKNELFPEPSVDGKKLDLFKRKCDFILGSSTDPKVVADITERVKGKKVMVILDSAHSKDHVLAELKAYSPLVPVGSYLIVQDTNLNSQPIQPDVGPGPMEAVEEFLKGNDQFRSDPSKEKLLHTCAPKGYLKRIK